MAAILKKSDPAHPSWKPPLGTKAFEVGGVTYYGNLTHINGLLVSHVVVNQMDEESWQVDGVLLEGTEYRSAIQVRRDRYGKKHEEKFPVQKGVCPLWRGKAVFLPLSFAAVFNNPRDLRDINPPKEGLIWEMCDCSMTRNTDRASHAIRIAKTKVDENQWDAFEIYAEETLPCFPGGSPLVSDEDLRSIPDWDTYRKVFTNAYAKFRRSMCAPATNGE